MTAHRTEASQARCGEAHCFFCGQCRSTKIDGLPWNADIREYGSRSFCSWQCRDNAIDELGGEAIRYERQEDGSYVKLPAIQ